MMKNKFYITTPIYYASGDPHIGHAFTTIYADVIARYKRLGNYDVEFSTGLDEHGAKIENIAFSKNISTQKFVDDIAEKYISLWDKLDIKYDDFIRTTSLKHKRNVVELINKLLSSGDIYEGFYEGFYCNGCENFISKKDLINGVCPDHLNPPQLIKEKNYFFKLKKYLPIIKQKILDDEISILPKNRKKEILNIIESGISDFSITREKVKWGIPFPSDRKQTIYVWVEALMNYITVLDYPSDIFLKYWPADVHIIGTEINKFHSIYWPAILLSLDLPLPKTIFVHGLFTINGQKMSKTIGNVINPNDLIIKYGSDASRYLLLSQFSAFEHGDIKEVEFDKKYNENLANGIGNLCERIFSLAVKNGICGISNNFKLDPSVLEIFNNFEVNYQCYMRGYDLFNALKSIDNLIREIDVYLELKKPWSASLYTDSNELDTILESLLWSIDKIKKSIEPFMPSTAIKINDFMLNLQINKGKKLNLFPRMIL